MERTEALPGGVVSFVLTDIEGSTRLWSERPADMEVAVPRHYAILDEIIEQHGGVRPIEQGEGDSVVAAFSGAHDAVLAAGAAQRSLTAELPWLRVRIAVHTGEALLRDERNYAGPSIIRCARLRSCGHGGQVLVSDTTARLVAGTLPDGCALEDLGIVHLRDLDEPEQAWQLVAPGVDTTFPPLRSLAPAVHNLRAPLSSLIGRHRELAEVSELLGSHRLVTLSGAGGVGKTRLAQQAAMDLVERHEGGTWWVELAPVTAGSQVVEQVAFAAGLGSPGAGDPTAVLARQLSSMGSTLVVLDNAEHLVEPVAVLAQSLLEACPQLRLLVTSREPLGVPGERVWRVPSLATPPRHDVPSGEELAQYDAALLFAERAREARPDLVIDDDAAAAIAAICERLDGIPLALELAASRSRTMPLDRLAAGLDDAFRLLTGGSRTAMARQRTLLASIAWSTDLLEGSDQVVVRRLAVFPGWFSFDAAEVVVGDGEVVAASDVLDALGRLVDKSLVQFDPNTDRYRVLETVRQFGADRMRDHDELGATRTRHAAWCATWADEVAVQEHALETGERSAMLADLVTALDWATAEAPELALRICVGLGPFLSALGPSTCHRLCDWIVALDRTTVPPPAWAGAVGYLAGRSVYLERPDVFLLVPDAVACADASDPRTSTYLQAMLRVPDLVAGRPDGMKELCADAIAHGHHGNAAWLAGAIAVSALNYGDLASVRHHLELLDGVLRGAGLEWNPDSATMGHFAALGFAVVEGRLDDARRLATGEVRSTTEYAWAAALGTVLVGVLIDDDELLDGPARWVEREEAPGFLLRAGALEARALLALRAEDTGAVADRAAAAWGIRSRNGHALSGPTTIEPLLIALLAAGRTDDAHEFETSWRAFTTQIGDPPMHVALGHEAAALVALHEGRDDEAALAAVALLELAQQCGFLLLVVNALLILAELADRRGDGSRAALLAGAATARGERLGYRCPPLGYLIDLDGLLARLREGHGDVFEEGSRLSPTDAIGLSMTVAWDEGPLEGGWHA